MSTLEEDIKEANKIINGKIQQNGEYPFYKYSQIYPFTNENLVECFKNFNFKNKRCLTVLGSSDQALDMYLKGACKITTFDINKLTKYYFYLKKAALLSNLTKEEYIRLFNPYSNKKYSYYYDTFSRICKNLQGDNLEFWSRLFDKYKGIDITRHLFYISIYSKTLENTIKYLSGNNYYKLRERAKDLDINFINTNIKNLPQIISEKYDFIYLSNIMDYASYMYSDIPSTGINALENFKKLILQLTNCLDENGKMVIAYLFSEIFPNESIIFNKKDFKYSHFINTKLEKTKRNTIIHYTKRTNKT